MWLWECKETKGTLNKCVGLWFYEIWAVSVMTDFLSNGNTSRNTNSYHQALKQYWLCHLMTSTYNATPDQNTYPHTSTYTTHTPRTHTFHHFSTFMKLRISPGIHLFGVKETWFISWGLQQIDVDEETPRSTRLNVDSHFWMLEDWVLSKINVVGLEDWNS